MTGYNFSHLSMTPEARAPVGQLPKVCKGCGGIRQRQRQWCAACHAARYPVSPPILTQDWSTVPLPVSAPVQVAHCGRWHGVDRVPVRLACCGVVLGDTP